MKSLIFFFSLIVTSSFAQDSTICDCCTLEHDQFDFWVGDWNVVDTAGKTIGQNKIVRLQDNCALQENWVSKAMTGTSYNYYNRSNKTWNQLWIDNKGGSLVLSGGIENGSMVMQSELLPGKKIDFYRNQITWTPNADGSVTQKWDILDEDGNILTNAFLGKYVRAEKSEETK